MPWHLSDLMYHLTDIIDDSNTIRTVILNAGLRPGFVNYQGSAVNAWSNVLKYAENNNKVPDVVAAAYKLNPGDAFLKSAMAGTYNPVRPLVDNDLVPAGLPAPETLEKVMGKYSTFLPVSWLETGWRLSRSVARVELASGASGTGFLLSNNYFLTNNHVLPDKITAGSAVIQFNYQQDENGLDVAFTPFELDPDACFETSPNDRDDWTLVKVKGDANRDWGRIELKPLLATTNDRANIIQHPGGGPKQIAFYHNVIEHAGDKRVQYLTDTLPGSSGSPVFDSQWRLIALHHAGGHLVDPSTKKSVYRNEGISVKCIAEALQSLGLAF